MSWAEYLLIGLGSILASTLAALLVLFVIHQIIVTWGRAKVEPHTSTMATHCGPISVSSPETKGDAIGGDSSFRINHLH